MHMKKTKKIKTYFNHACTTVLIHFCKLWLKPLWTNRIFFLLICLTFKKYSRFYLYLFLVLSSIWSMLSNIKWSIGKERTVNNSYLHPLRLEYKTEKTNASFCDLRTGLTAHQWFWIFVARLCDALNGLNPMPRSSSSYR